MSSVRYEVASIGANVSASGTPDIASVGGALTMLGVTTVTGFQTAPAGLLRTIHFETATPIVPGANLSAPFTSVTTSKGAVATLRSLGSGAWKIEHYTPATGNLGSTGAQSITTTAAGALLTLTSTDAGATEGPSLDLYRNSASPAASDIIGAVNFQGEDSAGNTETYVKQLVTITDPTSTSEDANLQTQTVVAGTLATRQRIGQGVTVGTTSVTDKGVGTVNAEAGLYVNGHGTVAQVVADTNATIQTTATTIPFDDTIPQITEGGEMLLKEITPTNASSTLEIDVNIQVGSSTTTTVTAALFVDSTADAINAMGESVDATTIRCIKYTHRVSAGSTSARTYRVRIGGASGTASMNGVNGGRKYGGVCTSSIIIREILPQ